MEFSRPEYWSEYLFPSPGDLPNTGVAPRSPTLQADILLTERESPRTLEWVAYPFSRGLPNPGIEPGSPALQVDSLQLICESHNIQSLRI